MPRRMSVWPAAIHTRTPVGSPIIAAPKLDNCRHQCRGRRRRNAHANVAPEFDRERWNIGSRSLAPIRRNHNLGKPRRSTPQIAPPPINLPGNHFPRRATSRTEAPGAKASATINRFCSGLHRRRSGPTNNTSILLIAPSLHRASNSACTVPRQIESAYARKAAAIGWLLCGLLL